jgi:hypothetical protein
MFLIIITLLIIKKLSYGILLDNPVAIVPPIPVI